MIKKTAILISVGVLNLIHGLVHLFQFLQSVLLASYSFEGNHESWLHHLIENPYTGIIWALIGLSTMYIGYKDYKHHKEENKK